MTSLVVDWVTVPEESNSMGLRALKDERIEELRLSRSLSCIALVDWCNGEPPLYRCEGIADLGFGPGGGDDPEPILAEANFGW